MKEVYKEYCNQLAIKRYSTNTIETYTSFFKKYLYYLHDLNIEAKNASEMIVKKYLEHLVFEKMISHTVQNQTINAIKFYYEKVLYNDRKFYYAILLG